MPSDVTKFLRGFVGNVPQGFGIGSQIAGQRGERKRQQEEAQRIAQLLQAEGASPEIVNMASSNPQQALQVWQREKANTQRVQAATTAYERTPFGGMTLEQQGMRRGTLSTGLDPLVPEERFDIESERKAGRAGQIAEAQAGARAKYRRPAGGSDEITMNQALTRATSMLKMGAPAKKIYELAKQIYEGTVPPSKEGWTSSMENIFGEESTTGGYLSGGITQDTGQQPAPQVGDVNAFAPQAESESAIPPEWEHLILQYKSLGEFEQALMDSPEYKKGKINKEKVMAFARQLLSN